MKNIAPSLGRVVHFTDVDGKVYPAIVTGCSADDDELVRVDLVQLGGAGSGVRKRERIPYSHDPKPSCWSWPRRELQPAPEGGALALVPKAA